VVKNRVFSINRVARTPSTQDLVRVAARAGAGDGYCCVAAEQTRGRGRHGRPWEAPPGSALLVSVLLRVPTPIAPGVPLAAGLAVADSLGDLCGVEVGLKWPNDVLINGRKLAGVLAEVEPLASSGTSTAVVVGLGLNVRVPEFPEGVPGVSLHEVMDVPPGIDDLLDAWLAALKRRVRALEAGGLAGLLPDWRRRAVGLGEPVSVSGALTVRGIAEDIDSDGALLIRTPEGVVRVLAGDVHLEAGPAA
jgi:BirA family biotin operon repressor/biotin-[acetyl-CoA-carboxylase] ligase